MAALANKCNLPAKVGLLTKSHISGKKFSGRDLEQSVRGLLALSWQVSVFAWRPVLVTCAQNGVGGCFQGPWMKDKQHAEPKPMECPSLSFIPRLHLPLWLFHSKAKLPGSRVSIFLSSLTTCVSLQETQIHPVFCTYGQKVAKLVRILSSWHLFFLSAFLPEKCGSVQKLASSEAVLA